MDGAIKVMTEMRAVRSIMLGLAASAATLAAQTAQAQVVTTGSTRIQTAGEVRIMEDGPTALLVAEGGVTFALSSGADGAVAVSMPGFIRQSSRSSDGLLVLTEGDRQVLTGTTLSSEALSVSVDDGTRGDQAAAPAEAITVILAQFN